jgi:hypothetical protein
VPLDTLVKDPPAGAVTSMMLVTVLMGGSVMVIVTPEGYAGKD